MKDNRFYQIGTVILMIAQILITLLFYKLVLRKLDTQDKQIKKLTVLMDEGKRIQTSDKDYDLE